MLLTYNKWFRWVYANASFDIAQHFSALFAHKFTFICNNSLQAKFENFIGTWKKLSFKLEVDYFIK